MFLEIVSVILLAVGCVNLGFALGVWKGTEDMARAMKENGKE